jgi:MYXO-CTERM domain-containing protein
VTTFDERGNNMKFIHLLSVASMSLLLAGAAARADWNSTISSATPLHWYTFEEIEGTTATDQGSGGLHGTYTGAVTLGETGLVGRAAAFDGTNYVLLSGADLAGDWTVEAIFKADTETGGVSMGLMGADFAAAAGRMGIKAEQWNETGQLGYTVFGVVDETFADAAAATPTDYTHVAFVGTAAGVELFVNGVSAGSGATATGLSRFVLGAGAVRADASALDGLTGAIDELVIYDRALSAGDIAAHHAAVPEPSAAVLALLGLCGLFAARRRRA